jgi:hypothetical protein
MGSPGRSRVGSWGSATGGGKTLMYPAMGLMESQRAGQSSSQDVTGPGPRSQFCHGPVVRKPVTCPLGGSQGLRDQVPPCLCSSCSSSAPAPHDTVRPSDWPLKASWAQCPEPLHSSTHVRNAHPFPNRLLQPSFKMSSPSWEVFFFLKNLDGI